VLRHDTEAIPVEKLVTKLDVTPQDFNNYQAGNGKEALNIIHDA
jgi:hypothetical protein